MEDFDENMTVEDKLAMLLKISITKQNETEELKGNFSKEIEILKAERINFFSLSSPSSSSSCNVDLLFWRLEL